MEILQASQFAFDNSFPRFFEKSNRSTTITPSGTIPVQKFSESGELSIDELESKVQLVNDQLYSMDKKMEYVIHQETNRLLVKIFDRGDDRLIKEIPAEKMLDIVAKLQEGIGLLVDRQI